MEHCGSNPFETTYKLKLIFILVPASASKIENKLGNSVPNTRANVKLEVYLKKEETEYKSNRGAGKYLSVFVKDDTGESKIIAFNVSVSKFVDKFEASKVLDFKTNS